ncbi:hypothetical protein C8Q76DRAFT_335472 [Earliella scabrosa]|nr:hypothetical protein C8Q76DRAFT_335472 [Earliella scabrosa]
MRRCLRFVGMSYELVVFACASMTKPHCAQGKQLMCASTSTHILGQWVADQLCSHGQRISACSHRACATSSDESSLTSLRTKR